MPTDQQFDNAVSFYSKWSDEKLVERLEYFEDSIAEQKAARVTKHSSTTIVKDQHFVDLLYYTLNQRNYFE